MLTLIQVIAGIVAAEHVYFLVLEMFLWNKPKGLKVFKMTQDHANATKVLAANQGLYNGFLAAGLIWGILAAPEYSKQIFLFFFGCVTAAGIFGGITVSPRIAVLQAIPALLGFLLTVFVMA